MCILHVFGHVESLPEKISLLFTLLLLSLFVAMADIQAPSLQNPSKIVISNHFLERKFWTTQNLMDCTRRVVRYYCSFLRSLRGRKDNHFASLSSPKCQWGFIAAMYCPVL